MDGRSPHVQIIATNQKYCRPKFLKSSYHLKKLQRQLQIFNDTDNS